jgi:hypothetical protein
MSPVCQWKCSVPSRALRTQRLSSGGCPKRVGSARTAVPSMGAPSASCSKRGASRLGTRRPCRRASHVGNRDGSLPITVTGPRPWPTRGEYDAARPETDR